MGITASGFDTKRSAITIAKTANTSQTSININIKNISLARLLTVEEATSAILLPFSLTLTTKAPKS